MITAARRTDLLDRAEKQNRTRTAELSCKLAMEECELLSLVATRSIVGGAARRNGSRRKKRKTRTAELKSRERSLQAAASDKISCMLTAPILKND